MAADYTAVLFLVILAIAAFLPIKVIPVNETQGSFQRLIGNTKTARYRGKNALEWAKRMKTGLTNQEKNADIWFDEKDPLIYIRTHNTDLKKRLAAYAGQ